MRLIAGASVNDPGPGFTFETRRQAMRVPVSLALIPARPTAPLR
jgi:hypothetical protein